MPPNRSDSRKKLKILLALGSVGLSLALATKGRSNAGGTNGGMTVRGISAGKGFSGQITWIADEDGEVPYIGLSDVNNATDAGFAVSHRGSSVVWTWRASEIIHQVPSRGTVVEFFHWDGTWEGMMATEVTAADLPEIFSSIAALKGEPRSSKMRKVAEAAKRGELKGIAAVRN